MAHLSAKVGIIGPSGSSKGLGQHQIIAAAILRYSSTSLRAGEMPGMPMSV